MSRILVDGVRYEVRVAGSGPPLLLVHGFTGRGSSWSTCLPALRRLATTIVVDMLGHGRSDCPADPARHAVERQAADLAAIVERVAGPVADVLGYSFGARIALRLAVDHTSLVRRLLLESPSAGITDPDARSSRRTADGALAHDLERDGIEAFVGRWEALPLFASLEAMPAGRRARLHEQRLRNRPEGLAASLRGAGQGVMTPLHDRLAGLRVPTLVIVGELDPVAGRARDVAGAIPGARLATIPDAGHMPHLEAPAAFRRLVVEYLAEPTAGRSGTIPAGAAAGAAVPGTAAPGTHRVALPDEPHELASPAT